MTISALRLFSSGESAMTEKTTVAGKAKTSRAKSWSACSLFQVSQAASAAASASGVGPP